MDNFAPKFFFLKINEYQKWIQKQTNYNKVQIAQRLSRIELDEYFGIYKYLGGNIWELKWENGRRIYYTYIPEKKILLLLGGNKNGQSKDVAQAKKICAKYTQIKN
jgi:putative addiction module killer protein